MKVTPEQLYQRQMILPEIGRKGQEKLQQAKVAVIGCGGLGNAAAVYLAGSGIGRMHLVDYDLVNPSNLHRQLFFGMNDVGKSKNRVLADHIEKISPFVHVSCSEIPLSKSTISDELDDYEIIVDCTDSLPTKYLLNDYCVINDKVLVYGSLYKHDGYVSTFNVKLETGVSANLRDAFPEMPETRVPNCAEIGTLNPIVGLIGLFQANEVIKLITGSGELLCDALLIYNAMENSQFLMKLKGRFTKERVSDIYAEERYLDERCRIQDPELLISAERLKQKLGADNLEVLSLIEGVETKLPFKADYMIPGSSFDVEQLNTDPGKELVVVCHKGISSYTVTSLIKERFPQKQVYSLVGGIENYR